MIKEFRNLSKGKILIKLENKLQYFVIPKTKIIRVSDWLGDSKSQLKFLKDYFYIQNKIKFLAIRSSAYDEDNKNSSKAGMYTSVLNVNILSNKDIKRAINEVIKSYKKKGSNIYKSEIIIQ